MTRRTGCLLAGAAYAALLVSLALWAMIAVNQHKYQL